jgi:hypothetical protein
MRDKSNIWLWMATALSVSIALALAVFAVKGVNNKSVGSALQVTARWSFLLFWLAYTGGALAILFGPAFAPLASRRREFGLAFAAGMQAHFALLGGIFLFTHRPPLTGRILVFFLTAAFLTYLLTISSFGGLSRTLSSKRWRWLRTVAVNYIWLAFARDFVPVLFHWPKRYDLGSVEYSTLALMAVSAPLLVAAASVFRRWRTSPTGRWSPADGLASNRYQARTT